MYSGVIPIVLILFGVMSFVFYKYKVFKSIKKRLEDSIFTTNSIKKKLSRKRRGTYPASNQEINCSVDTQNKALDETTALSALNYGDIFTKRVSCETDRLLELCSIWEEKVQNCKVNEGKQNALDEIEGELSIVVGKTKMLIDGRFAQFKSLIQDINISNEIGRKNKVNNTTYEDLQGFWELIYLQVEDLDKRFDTLISLYNHVTNINGSVHEST